MTQERKSANLTATQLAEGNLNLSLIGAQVLVLKGEEAYCGTLQYFWTKESPVYKRFADNAPSGEKTTIMFMFEGGARAEFDSAADDVNIEILYPAGV